MRNLVICVALLATALAPATLCLSGTHETTFRSDEIGISFIYPSVWGQAVVRDYRGTASYMDYGVDWQIEFTENPRPCRSYLLARSLSKSGNLRIVAYEGSIDTTDLDLLRQDIAVKPDRRVDGHSARVVDMYYEPSGEAWRVTSWFSEDQFFEFCEAADVYDFEGKAEDAGLKRGVTQMCQANPSDVRLIEFTKATGRLLDSFGREDRVRKLNCRSECDWGSAEMPPNQSLQQTKPPVTSPACAGAAPADFAAEAGVIWVGTRGA